MTLDQSTIAANNSMHQFMRSNIGGLKEIIESLSEKIFDTHDFIRNFAKKYESDYIDFLYNSPNKTFHTVHSQIGRFLEGSQEELKIASIGRQRSLNVFGLKTENELWEKQ